MHLLLLILSIVAGIFALILITAVLVKKSYVTHAEILIEAPVPRVFDYLRHIKNQDNFNIWVMTDPAMKRDYRGTDGHVGFVYAWNGNKKAGEGEQEILAITDNISVDMEIRFVRPFAGIAHATMATDLAEGNNTRVIWNTSSEVKFPFNIMTLFIPKMLEKDMQISLTKLKAILEN